MKEALQNTQYESLIKTATDSGIGYVIIVGLFILSWKFLPKVFEIIASWVEGARVYNDSLLRILQDLSTGLNKTADSMSENALAVAEMARAVGSLPCSGETKRIESCDHREAFEMKIPMNQ